MDDAELIRALREQLSHLCSLFTLSMVMSDGRDERQIVALAVSSVRSLTSCRPIASILTSTGGDLRAPDGNALAWPELTTRLKELDGADSRVAAGTELAGRYLPGQLPVHRAAGAGRPEQLLQLTQ